MHTTIAAVSFIRGRSRKGVACARAGVSVGLGTILLLTGCFAQQADLVKVSTDLDKKISRLDQREKEIDGAVRQASEQIAQQKKDVDQLIHETRARLLAEIREMREEDLPKFQGKLDENLYQVKALAGSVDDRASKLEQTLGKRDAEAEKRFAALEKTVARKEEMGKLSSKLDATGATLSAMAKTVDGKLEEHDKAIGTAETQTKAVAEQLAHVSRALTEFKHALTGLGDKLVQQEQRTNELAAKEEAGAKATAALHKKVDQDSKVTNDHLEKVNKSVGSVAKAVEAIGARFVAQEEAQDRRLDELTKSLRAATVQINAVSQTMKQARGAKGKELKPARSAAEGGSEARHEPAHHAAPEPAAVPVESGASESSEVRPSAESLAVSEAPGSESGPAAAMAEAPGAVEEKPVTVRAVYDRAMQKFKQRDWDGATEGFSDVLAKYPTSELAPNAQFWIGECYYGKGDYDRAIEIYDQVRVGYPNSEKVPAALFKKGLAYLALKDRKQASLTLTQVVEAFPKSPEAGKARDKLAQLRQTP